MPGLGVWEQLPPQQFLVLAIPHTGLVCFDWAIKFRVLQPPVPFNVISNRGLPIDRARCDLVNQAKMMKASHIFFLDSDVMMPPDGLQKLWSHHLPIAAGVYGSKHETTDIWIEQAKSGNNRYAAVLPEALNQVLGTSGVFTHPDLVTGCGCVLIDMKVLDRLEEPYFLWTQGRESNGISEDFYFFEKCRKADIPIHIDVSVQCGHIDFSQLDWTGKRGKLAF